MPDTTPGQAIPAEAIGAARPPLADLHYVAACEAAHLAVGDSTADVTFGGVEDLEQLIGDIIDAVWPILHAPAHADGVEAGRDQSEND